MNSRPLALVVEDDCDQTTLLRRLLDREGFEVFATSDAEAAVSAFPRISPSLAVVDLLLPGMSGRECAGLVKEKFPRCFVVISSVLDVGEYPSADAALPKPITGERLHTAVAKVAR